MTLGPRIAIVGPSGAGKTTMARLLAHKLALDLLELDRVHWAGSVGIQRDEQEAKGLVRDFAANSGWIVEGVYGWLAAPAVPLASTLIWLDLPWKHCRAGLAERGRWRGATDEQHAAFLVWAEAYWSRETSSSFKEHRLMFDAFAGAKLHLSSRAAITAVVSDAQL